MAVLHGGEYGPGHTQINPVKTNTKTTLNGDAPTHTNIDTCCNHTNKRLCNHAQT